MRTLSGLTMWAVALVAGVKFFHLLRTFFSSFICLNLWQKERLSLDPVTGGRTSEEKMEVLLLPQLIREFVQSCERKRELPIRGSLTLCIILWFFFSYLVKERAHEGGHYWAMEGSFSLLEVVFDCSSMGEFQMYIRWADLIPPFSFCSDWFEFLQKSDSKKVLCWK